MSKELSGLFVIHVCGPCRDRVWDDARCNCAAHDNRVVTEEELPPYHDGCTCTAQKVDKYGMPSLIARQIIERVSIRLRSGEKNKKGGSIRMPSRPIELLPISDGIRSRDPEFIKYDEMNRKEILRER